MGCGMVDPMSLKIVELTTKNILICFWNGDRSYPLLLHQINDIRLLSENDIRFLSNLKVPYSNAQ